MSQFPVASLLSPNKDYVLLYEVRNVQQQVSISRFGLEPQPTTYFAYKQRPAPKGPIDVPSCITPTYMYGVPTVYGWITVPKEGTETEDITVLSQISPSVYTLFDDADKKLGKLPGSNRSIGAVSNGNDRLYLYFFQPSADNKTLKLVSYFVNKNNKPVSSDHSGASNLAEPKTNLAAVSTPKGKDAGKDVINRAVLYQLKEGESPLYCVHWTGEVESETKIKGTENSKTGTPLAAVCVGPLIYLYYLSDKNKIYRVVGEDGGAKWRQPEKVKDVDDPREDTNLSVSIGPNGNYLFYVRSDSGTEEFSCICDPLA